VLVGVSWYLVWLVCVWFVWFGVWLVNTHVWLVNLRAWLVNPRVWLVGIWSKLVLVDWSQVGPYLHENLANRLEECYRKLALCDAPTLRAWVNQTLGADASECPFHAMVVLRGYVFHPLAPEVTFVTPPEGVTSAFALKGATRWRKKPNQFEEDAVLDPTPAVIEPTPTPLNEIFLQQVGKNKIK